jgi:hypothetical protein
MPFARLDETELFHVEALGDVLRLVYYEQSGHYPFVEEAEVFRDAVRGWLAGGVTTPARPSTPGQRSPRGIRTARGAGV